MYLKNEQAPLFLKLDKKQQILSKVRSNNFFLHAKFELFTTSGTKN